MKIVRFLNTVRYLTLDQIFFQVYYKVRNKVRSILGCRRSYRLYKKGNKLGFLTEWIDKSQSYKGDDLFSFLNVESKFTGKWDDKSNGDLWCYNLNYMDFLLQDSMTLSEGYSWIERFITDIDNNSIADHPYPISLRGINWIKFVSLHYDEFTEEQLRKIDTALYSQYKVLMRNTERHLKANHYLENGFSLMFAACYFEDDRFFRKAKRILKRELKEQILSDGAHFELSPMYHCIILDRLMDCWNVLVPSKYFEFAAELYNPMASMMQWLESIMIEEDQIPLFNDAANGIAPTIAELRDYAWRLEVELKYLPLYESGYKRWRTKSYQVVADVGQLGPSYNLGHSHADTFSFVMNIANKPFIVDTGTSVYTAGERREYERSTKAHNTVCIDGQNSSQVWGAFRCAKRATVKILDRWPSSIRASHNGYKSLGIKCEREFNSMNDRFEITDVVEGNIKRVREARFHLAETVQVVDVQNNKVVTSLACLEFDGATAVNIENVEISSEFGILKPSKCISVRFARRLCTNIIPNKELK